MSSAGPGLRSPRGRLRHARRGPAARRGSSHQEIRRGAPLHDRPGDRGNVRREPLGRDRKDDCPRKPLVFDPLLRGPAARGDGAPAAPERPAATRSMTPRTAPAAPAARRHRCRTTAGRAPPTPPTSLAPAPAGASRISHLTFAPSRAPRPRSAALVAQKRTGLARRKQPSAEKN